MIHSPEEWDRFYAPWYSLTVAVGGGKYAVVGDYGNLAGSAAPKRAECGQRGVNDTFQNWAEEEHSVRSQARTPARDRFRGVFDLPIGVTNRLYVSNKNGLPAEGLLALPHKLLAAMCQPRRTWRTR